MQGFNMGRYVPPDVEGTTSANKLHRKHALGQRASKLASHGTLTVRFEMPFPVWCASCPQPTVIGQGVRFNAEKKKVGSYYTTPVWSFRFRHAQCGGAIEMCTDPKNTAYVVVQGATRRDVGEAARDGDEALVVLTDREREALRRNAFASLERTIEDRERATASGRRIDELVDAQARLWEDAYAMNQKLRRAFRVGREEREREAARTEALKDRMGLAVELLPATEEDARRAALVDFGLGEEGDDDDDDDNNNNGGGGGGGSAVNKALARPLFGTAPAAADAPPRRKADFASAVVSNTRAAQDPFLQRRPGAKAAKIPGVKRKRSDPDRAAAAGAHPRKAPACSRGHSRPTGLVEYDSD
ncbi:uncharacterized protein UV8b_06234 [Ustilaginoidea virens]|uniref:Uncharacterized protein n=1 Tax=Ustilaginoidea virens TaxID=1159556 RepID=A0A063C4E9_USTVR|nr:uncharacterized protein UV8b_06234 [Ustilaginoidea virens]QUC21993.1 hypothetical protein UV8b_06234 [Ustilaginoidea virens]GAO18294.1 hypothetical protein UVI_02023280 [Ustilaginoidea virens]